MLIYYKYLLLLRHLIRTYRRVVFIMVIGRLLLHHVMIHHLHHRRRSRRHRETPRQSVAFLHIHRPAKRRLNQPTLWLLRSSHKHRKWSFRRVLPDFRRRTTMSWLLSLRSSVWTGWPSWVPPLPSNWKRCCASWTSATRESTSKRGNTSTQGTASTRENMPSRKSLETREACCRRNFGMDPLRIWGNWSHRACLGSLNNHVIVQRLRYDRHHHPR